MQSAVDCVRSSFLLKKFAGPAVDFLHGMSLFVYPYHGIIVHHSGGGGRSDFGSSGIAEGGDDDVPMQDEPLPSGANTTVVGVCCSER